MHIVLTSDTVGGLGIHAETLATALQERGHQVTWVPLPTPLEWESDRSPAQLDSARAAAHKALTRLGHVDILHCNHFGCVGAIPGVPSLLAIHSDVVSWWRAVHGRPPPPTPFHRWYTGLVASALAAADTVVAPSAAVLADLRHSFAYHSPATVVPNGMPPPPPAPVRTRRGALIAARLTDAAKQVRLLLRPDLPMDVVLAGDAGPQPWPVFRRLVHVGPLSRVEIAARFASAAVYIAPSRYEPFGLAPLEAALAGCCLLLNNLPVFREIWGGAAYYFAANDGDDLVRWLRRLAHDPDLIAAGARAAQARARARYSAATMAERYEALYLQIAATCPLAPVP